VAKGLVDQNTEILSRGILGIREVDPCVEMLRVGRCLGYSLTRPNIDS
jgi:hypothetical protein